MQDAFEAFTQVKVRSEGGEHTFKPVSESPIAKDSKPAVILARRR